jgi:hypothetical protein
MDGKGFDASCSGFIEDRRRAVREREFTCRAMFEFEMES